MQVSIHLTDSEFNLLQEQTQKSGHKTVEGFIKSKLFKTSNVIKNFLEEALSRANSKAKGESFVLKELFSSDEWDSFPFGQRKALGKLFYAHVTRTPKYNIKATEKNSSGQQQYTKN